MRIWNVTPPVNKLDNFFDAYECLYLYLYHTTYLEIINLCFNYVDDPHCGEEKNECYAQVNDGLLEPQTTEHILLGKTFCQLKVTLIFFFFLFYLGTKKPSTSTAIRTWVPILKSSN